MAGSGKGSSRVGGVGDGPERASGVGAAGPANHVEGTEGVSEVDEVRATRAAEVGAVKGAEAIGESGAADPVTEVAAALRAGKLSVAEAVDRLIDDAITRRVGRAVEQGSELEARLRRVLRDYAGADPLISSKIRRLEARRGGRGGHEG